MNNGFNGMNGTNGYGLNSPSSFNSPVGLNGTNFGGMNGSNGYNSYNSMYGGMNGLPSPHSNGKLNTPYGAKNNYGLQSPYATGGIGGYSPYKPNDNMNMNNMGLWNRRPGSDMNSSPLRRRLSI